MPTRSGSTRMPQARTRPPARSLISGTDVPGERYDDAAVAHGRERTDCRIAADCVEDDVDVARLRADVLSRVVDRLVRADPTEELVLRRAGRRDHVPAACLGDLHREMSDSARRAEHEHARALGHVGGLVQRLPGGEPCERQRSRLDVGDAVRDRCELS